MTGKSLLLDSFGRILNGFDSRFGGFGSLLDRLLNSLFNLLSRLLLVVRKADAFKVVGEVEGDAGDQQQPDEPAEELASFQQSTVPYLRQLV